jgi:hypothetical protein
MKNDVIIGIDPDVDKSGVCLLYTHSQHVLLANVAFPALLDKLLELRESTKRIGLCLIVVVEAGWLVDKSNYHETHGSAGEKIAKNTGSNHQVGKLILEMCRHYGIECDEQYPLTKGWRGPKGKITHEEIASFISSFPKFSNQETRDAALIAWNYANFPIRVKPLGR